MSATNALVSMLASAAVGGGITWYLTQRLQRIQQYNRMFGGVEGAGVVGRPIVEVDLDEAWRPIDGPASAQPPNTEDTGTNEQSEPKTIAVVPRQPHGESGKSDSVENVVDTEDTSGSNTNLSCLVCGSTKKLKRCSKCKEVVYCSAEHQRLDWPNHKSSCKKVTQMALYCCGQSTTLTPLQVPLSSGDINTLSRDKFATIFHCPSDFVEFRISPLSTKLDKSEWIVCAYNVGTQYTRYRQTLQQFPNYKSVEWGNGALCYHVVYMTAELHDRIGHQVNGEAIFFFLKPGKDFYSTHFNALRAAREYWFREDLMSNRQRIAVKKLFYKQLEELSKPSRRSSLISSRTVKALWFPAIGGIKPVLVDVLVDLLQDPDEQPEYSTPYEIAQRDQWLGEHHLEMKPIYPAWGSSNTDRGDDGYGFWVFMRETFLVDGSPLNQTILQGTKGKTRHKWAGNLLAIKTEFQRFYGSEGKYVNAKIEDARRVFDYFSTYGS